MFGKKKPSVKPGMIRITMYIEPEEHAKMKRIAKRRGDAVAVLQREAIREFNEKRA